MKVSEIARAYDLYRAVVIPKDAGATQIAEIRKAFYAGSWATFQTMCKISDQEEDASVEEIEGLNKELRQFIAETI